MIAAVAGRAVAAAGSAFRGVIGALVLLMLLGSGATAGTIPLADGATTASPYGYHAPGEQPGREVLMSNANPRSDDAQRVLDDFHSGSATVLGVKRNDIVVRTNSVTGFNHNPGAGFPNQPTNVFFIKGSSSPSVVPYNPTWP